MKKNPTREQSATKANQFNVATKPTPELGQLTLI
jgi:hypothetical protein